MKVKIGSATYDSNETPIMLILDDIDKQNISNMHLDKYKFVSFPEGMDIFKVRKWMKDEPVDDEAPVLFSKHLGRDFFASPSASRPALTLSPECIGVNDSGWTITGEIHEDNYQWVNEFEAKHPEYGKLFGDFEHTVFYEKEEGFQHFWEHHEPEAWDYYDI